MIALDVIVGVTALVAIASLILEYGGFRPRPVPLAVLHLVDAIVVGVFIADRAVRFLLPRRKAEYFRQNWLDAALIALAVLAFVIGPRISGHVLPAGALYVIITQAYILLALTVRAMNVNLRFAGSGIPPSWLLIGSFAVLCLAGSGLLMLPAAAPPPDSVHFRITYYTDALFTAVSATCVTGLIVRDTGLEWAPFGQAVILLLIQLGGLGIMMFGTLLALLVGKGLGLRQSNTLGQVLGTQVGSLGRVVRFVVSTTLVMEAIGAVAMYPMFRQTVGATGEPLSAGQAAWYSVFHSISAFCNAGFSLYAGSLTHVRSQVQVLGVFAPLIVIGGLGFPVLQDLAGNARVLLRSVFHRAGLLGRRQLFTSHTPRFSLHTKIVLVTTAILIVTGAAGLLLLEPSSAVGSSGNGPSFGLAGLSGWPRIREAIFQSVTARTAGFNTIDMAHLSSAGQLWMCLLMVIGGSPASTAGGMKTVTFALLVGSAYCMLRKRNELELFRRRIGSEMFRKVATLALLYIGLLTIVTLLLCRTMRGYPFMDLLFEACSACGTVGLSTGITGKLNEPGKYIIMAGMFLGRVGPLTMLLALAARVRPVRYSYATEDVVIG